MSYGRRQVAGGARRDGATAPAGRLTAATASGGGRTGVRSAVGDGRCRVPPHRETPGACEPWSVKDILAHLDAWHGMWLRWEHFGVRGEPTPMPAEGFTWAQTPDLNARIHADTAGDPSRSWSVEEVRIPG